MWGPVCAVRPGSIVFTHGSRFATNLVLVQRIRVPVGTNLENTVREDKMRIEY